MRTINKIYQYIKCPFKFIDYFGCRGKLKWIPDKVYLKMVYQARMGKKLNLNNPVTYNEKLQWLKLYDRNPDYIKLVDKYQVREYVAKTIGSQYLIPLYGVYSHFDEIDFDKLPNQFVLKAAHDCGGIVICKNKNELDIKKVKRFFNQRLKRNYFYPGREWPYKYVKPRIVCEKLLSDPTGEILKDYKFYCFHGEVKSLLVISDRGRDIRYDYYDIDFNHQDYTQQDRNSSKVIPKPENYDKMLALAETLSGNFPHVRVDFYNVDGKIYFGEMTLYNDSGFRCFEPVEYDNIYGSWITII